MTGTLAKRIDRLEKNYLMNGAFDFWQRGGVSAPINTTTSLVYSAMDRWRVSHTGTFTGTPAVGRDPTVPDNAFPYCSKHTYQRNASTATLTYEQRIESRICAELSVVGFASFSLYVFPFTAGSIRLTVLTPTVIDNHASQTQQYQSSVNVTASSWQQVTFPAIAIPGAANLGLAVRVEYIMGSGTDGSVQSFFMTRAMLNAGKLCSDYQRYALMYDQELVGCMRYLEKSYDLDVSLQTVTTAGCYEYLSQNSNSEQRTIQPKVFKRATPTVTIYSTQTGASGSFYRVGVGDEVATTENIGTSTFSLFRSGGAIAGALFRAQWAMESEL